MENNLAYLIAPGHTLAEIRDHMLLLQGIQASGPVTEPKTSKVSYKRKPHFFQDSDAWYAGNSSLITEIFTKKGVYRVGEF